MAEDLNDSIAEKNEEKKRLLEEMESDDNLPADRQDSPRPAEELGEGSHAEQVSEEGKGDTIIVLTEAAPGQPQEGQKSPDAEEDTNKTREVSAGEAGAEAKPIRWTFTPGRAYAVFKSLCPFIVLAIGLYWCALGTYHNELNIILFSAGIIFAGLLGINLMLLARKEPPAAEKTDSEETAEAASGSEGKADTAA